jgi:hypothetical protein
MVFATRNMLGLGLIGCLLAVGGMVEFQSKDSVTWVEQTIGLEASGFYKPAGSRPVSKINIEFEPRTKTEGWTTTREAAVAFYEAHDALYLETGAEQEIAGFLMVSNAGRYYFTNGETVPAAFKMRARVRAPKGWRLGEFLHTHPGGDVNQDKFSEADREAVVSGKRAYFLRGPSGDVRFMDRELAKATRLILGALGESICAGSEPCLSEHPRHDLIGKRLAGSGAIFRSFTNR